MAHKARIAKTDMRNWLCPFCGELNAKGGAARCDKCLAHYHPLAGSAIAIQRDHKLTWGSVQIESLASTLRPEIEAVRTKQKRLEDVQEAILE